MYPASLPLMRKTRLPVVDWTDAPADLNGIVRFSERRNVVSECMPSHFKRSLPLSSWTGIAPWRWSKPCSCLESHLGSQEVEAARISWQTTIGSGKVVTPTHRPPLPLQEIPLVLISIVWRRTAVAQWLRYCATNRKVAGSIPAGVIENFHWQNPSDRTMALGSTQPLTEMSTRSISWG